jgi:hypothetical protein
MLVSTNYLYILKHIFYVNLKNLFRISAGQNKQCIVYLIIIRMIFHL